MSVFFNNEDAAAESYRQELAELKAVSGELQLYTDHMLLC